ncbi:AAEL008802-PA [Aedes aegypti]|uniref:AAEL008802-PA n=2 Tax=Aedes aegypti TaxID=7159 RepID=Q16XN9_AEDAE|nr:putative salivary secreted peptide [Aedes aegypti]EAT39403.1 AAEL008802-PA [Aedes aegypti]
MAKLGLLFIVIFCIIQLTLAARIRRDAFDEAVDSVKKGISDTFTKENVDNFLGKLSELGDVIKSKATEIGSTLQEKAQEAMKKE